MKKSLREHLAQSLTMMSQEEQQAEREAHKAGKLTPTTAAALALLLHEALETAKPSASAPASSEISTLLAEVRAVKTAMEKKSVPATTGGMSEAEKHEVNKRLGGIEDNVRAIRPSTFKALLVCLLLGGVIGSSLGWYACVAYHTPGVRHRQHIVEAE